MKKELEKRIEVLKKLSESEQKINKVCYILISSLRNGGKVILCGNGGSASDSSHITAEFIGKVKHKDTNPLPAISLSADPAVITAIANDYGYEHIFSKQIEAIGKKGDVLIVFSTSGSSKNIISAVEKAKEKGLKVIYFTGIKKPSGAENCDLVFNIPSDNKQIIQEVYMSLWHIIVDKVEKKMER